MKSIEKDFYVVIAFALSAIYMGMVFLPMYPMVDMGEKFDYLPLVYSFIGSVFLLSRMIVAIMDID